MPRIKSTRIETVPDGMYCNKAKKACKQLVQDYSVDVTRRRRCGLFGEHMAIGRNTGLIVKCTSCLECTAEDLRRKG